MPKSDIRISIIKLELNDVSSKNIIVKCYLPFSTRLEFITNTGYKIIV